MLKDLVYIKVSSINRYFIATLVLILYFGKPSTVINEFFFHWEKPSYCCFWLYSDIPSDCL